ncbi:dienelactone hydrolase family protein [Krasilnikovia sp. MM14-A1259]|uniref:dienelactone hydrolase family protein n=1 Tax=Krasilnikovia sp. MM14-A1259 TaxID=3373539 RepID=UPI00380D0567
MRFVDLSEASAAHGGSPTLRAYLATPAGDGPWPGLLVVHESFGLTDVVMRHADRLAAAGYLALAVDLYSAGGMRRCLVSTVLAARRGQGRAFTDLETGRAWLAASPQCTGRVGVIGFCLGGGFALLLAGTGRYDAAAVNYGELPRDLDGTVAGACPLVGSYAGRDWLPGSAPKLSAALTRAGVPHDVKEYPAAGHSFLNDAATGPKILWPLMRVAHIGPEPEAAADAWQRIESFFGDHLH